jgi:hypothetical protein
MNDLSFAKNIIDPNLLKDYIELSKGDEILSKAIDKATNIQTLVNSLLAAIICNSTREKYFADEISNFLKSHPDMSQAIQSKQMKDLADHDNNR